MEQFTIKQAGVPFAMVPNWVIEKHSVLAVAVYSALASFANRDRECFPSMQTLATLLKITANTARKGVAELEEGETVTVERSKNQDGSCGVNVYTLHTVPLDLRGVPQTLQGGTAKFEEGVPQNLSSNKNHLNKNHITRKNKQKEKSVLTDEQVQRFKSVYPQRLGTKNWPKAIELLHKNAEHYDEIVRGAIAYGKTVEAGTKWVKAPYNFLRDGLWTEYADSPQTPLTVPTKLSPEELAERIKNNPVDYADEMPSLKAISPGGVWRKPKRSMEELFELARQQEIAGTT